MKTIAATGSFALVLFFAACATVTAASSTQPLTSSPASQGSSTVEVQPGTTNPEQTGLEIETTPADAQVYLNDTFIGDTPLLYTNFRTGTYKITISKRGYYDSVRWLTLDPTAYTLLQTDLRPKIGYLLVEATPSDATIRIDGERVDAGIHQLPVGPHTVRVSAFGYEELKKNVEVQENRTVNVRATLTRAPFRISDLTVSRRLVSPLNPGRLGSVIVSFHVSTQGIGRLVVKNPQGQTVFDHAFAPFSQRDHAFVWTVRANDGRPLPSGSYRIAVSGREKAGSPLSQLSTTIIVDRGALIGLRSMASGSSGLLFTPTPEVLPSRSYAVSAQFLAPFEGSSVPTQLAFRSVPHAGVELDGQAAAQLSSSTSVPFSVGAAAKISLARPRGRDGFSAAADLKATYQSPTADTNLTNPTGFSVAFPVEYRWGPLGLVVSPELVAAPYPPSSGSPSAFSPTLFAYGRGGLLLDFGSVVTGASIALRTQSLGSGFGLAAAPLAAGWELHWLIPGTQLVVSTSVVAESTQGGGTSFLAGAGIGFVN